MIDLTELLKKLWIRRRLVVRNAIIFGILGVIIALISEKEFRSETSFITNTGGEPGFGSGLSGLAGLAGFNLSQLGSESDVSLVVYPNIVESKSFREALMNTKLYKPGFADSVTYTQYYDSLYSPSILSTVGQYTIGLPFVIIELFRGEPKQVSLEQGEASEIKTFGPEMEEHMKRLDGQLYLEISAEKNLVVVTFVMDDALLSAQMLQSAKQLLQEYLIAFQIKKARSEFDFTQKLYTEKREEYEEAQLALASFEDSNIGMATAKAALELDRLRREKDLTFEVFSEISKQLEQVKLKLEKDTPIFSTIEPVSVPSRAAAPRKILVVLSWLIIGMIFTTAYIVWFERFKLLIQTVKSAKSGD